ncbi:MAG TPA: pyridoxal-phosphate dependent enzyme [Agriterribacter sp.]|nr:pyridoxal-phosphate dependent enzyme [Agriterribacter sp.]
MNPNEIIFAGTAATETVENALTLQKKVQLSVLRLDRIHPEVSGNKWFKLQYYIRDAIDKGYSSLLTFGGPYSNHIAATAYAAKSFGLTSIGIIRGEEPSQWSHTLVDARQCQMQLVFLSRKEYDVAKRNLGKTLFEKQFDNAYIVPEGGYGILGVQGASKILDTNDISSYTHIVSAVGTGTTIAGLLQSSSADQQVIGISCMKNNTGLLEEIQFLLRSPLPERFHLIHDYHFGGYARQNNRLTTFMNQFYKVSGIPLDFVYTAKMMCGVFDLIGKDFFPARSSILAIHSGGLQGNRSLAGGILEF